MEQKDKELLLKDLCARLPYGTIILHEGWNYEWDDSLSTWERVVGMDDEFVYTKVIDKRTREEYREDKWSISTFDDKPYLRPMSSMTEEEIKKFSVLEVGIHLFKGPLIPSYNTLDWLNAHHFDYRGLIEEGLAIAVTEENNPYKE